MAKRAGPDRHTLKAFGAAVRQIRLQRAMSQEDLALACGLDRTYIGGIERGERNIGLLNLVLIARTLRVRPSELVADLNAP